MIYTHSLDYAIISEHTEILVQTGRLETRVPGGASSIPREQHTRLLWQPTSPHIYSGPEGHTDTNNKAGKRYIPRNVTLVQAYQTKNLNTQSDVNRIIKTIYHHHLGTKVDLYLGSKVNLWLDSWI